MTIASPRDPLAERLQRSPRWLRRQVTRIPDRLQPAPQRTVRVQAYDVTGRLAHDLPVDDSEPRTRHQYPGLPTTRMLIIPTVASTQVSANP